MFLKIIGASNDMLASLEFDDMVCFIASGFKADWSLSIYCRDASRVVTC